MELACLRGQQDQGADGGVFEGFDVWEATFDAVRADRFASAVDDRHRVVFASNHDRRSGRADGRHALEHGDWTREVRSSMCATTSKLLRFGPKRQNRE